MRCGSARVTCSSRAVQAPCPGSCSISSSAFRASGRSSSKDSPLKGLRIGSLSQQLRSIDPDVPLYDIHTLEWRVRRLVMPQRMGATLFGGFAALALILASVGIYGVAAYVAKLRTREIGIRIALGADRACIHALVLRQGAVPVAAGIAAGLLIAAAGGQLAASFLRGVTPRDPLTYAGVAVLLGVISLIATWLPARRASLLDPVRALRHD